jgi:hypothetical protein
MSEKSLYSLLELHILSAFPKEDFNPKLLVAQRYVDGERINSILNKNWWCITDEEIESCSIDMAVMMTAHGLAYFLPAILLNLSRKKDFDWFEDILLPSGAGFESVIEHFSGGVHEPELVRDASSKVTFFADSRST